METGGGLTIAHSVKYQGVAQPPREARGRAFLMGIYCVDAFMNERTLLGRWLRCRRFCLGSLAVSLAVGLPPSYDA